MSIRPKGHIYNVLNEYLECFYVCLKFLTCLPSFCRGTAQTEGQTAFYACPRVPIKSMFYTSLQLDNPQIGVNISFWTDLFTLHVSDFLE